MVVTVTGLSIRYPALEAEALRDFSLTVDDGEIILLAGPTGCGKSTVLMAMAGVIPEIVHAEVRGEIKIAGCNPSHTPVSELSRDVGYLFQNVETQLFTDKVEDEVLLPLEFGAVRAGEMMESARAALDRYGMAAMRLARVSSLSSGFKQRLAMASLYLEGKKVLLLDEPFSYLDAASVEDLKARLLELKNIGVSVVVAEHREDIVSPIADRVVRMGGEKPINLQACRVSRHDSSTPGLEARDLHFSYKDNKVLKGVSLKIELGQCLCVTGENGSGKTTLCHLLSGVLKPHSGKVYMGGADLSAMKARERARVVSLALQNPDRQLFASSVFQEAPGDFGENCLARLGLQKFKNRHPRSLSFGQKRRLTLAKLLAVKPKLLVIDEPSVGQDSDNLESLFGVLASYLEDGGTMVVTTHDPRVKQAFQGRELELKEGVLSDPEIKLKAEDIHA